MALRYEIETGTNAVRVFYPDADAPSLFQPDWPDTTPWTDTAEATAWAQLYIASVEDEDAPYAPTGPGQPAKAKPTPEQRAAIAAAQETLEAATTPEERQAAQAALRAIHEAME
jgi:hypothetical protein